MPVDRNSVVVSARSDGMSARHLVFARLQGWADGEVLVKLHEALSPEGRS